MTCPCSFGDFCAPGAPSNSAGALTRGLGHTAQWACRQVEGSGCRGSSWRSASCTRAPPTEGCPCGLPLEEQLHTLAAPVHRALVFSAVVALAGVPAHGFRCGLPSALVWTGGWSFLRLCHWDHLCAFQSHLPHVPLLRSFKCAGHWLGRVQAAQAPLSRAQALGARRAAACTSGVLTWQDPTPPALPGACWALLQAWPPGPAVRYASVWPLPGGSGAGGVALAGRKAVYLIRPLSQREARHVCLSVTGLHQSQPFSRTADN